MCSSPVFHPTFDAAGNAFDKDSGIFLGVRQPDGTIVNRDSNGQIIGTPIRPQNPAALACTTPAPISVAPLQAVPQQTQGGFAQPRQLGNDPVTGAPILVRKGIVRDGKNLPDFVTNGELNRALPEGVTFETATLELALQLLIPRTPHKEVPDPKLRGTKPNRPRKTEPKGSSVTDDNAKSDKGKTLGKCGKHIHESDHYDGLVESLKLLKNEGGKYDYGFVDIMNVGAKRPLGKNRNTDIVAKQVIDGTEHYHVFEVKDAKWTDFEGAIGEAVRQSCGTDAGWLIVQVPNKHLDLARITQKAVDERLGFITFEDCTNYDTFNIHCIPKYGDIDPNEREQLKKAYGF